MASDQIDALTSSLPSENNMPPKGHFLNQPAPENYVAGLGRGATGFTTRSDLGPARSGPSEGEIKEHLAKKAAALGTTGPIGADGKKDIDEDDDERFQDPDDEAGLFASAAYDKDDEEADQVWQMIDDKMAKRRKVQREARERKEKEEYDRKNPKIQQQFADLKRSLATMTDEDWNSIPEVGDMTGKNKRQKRENQANRRFYAVPDSVIAGANAQGQFETSISADDPNAADGGKTNFADIGRARDKVLQLRLDQAAQNGGSSTQGSATSVDPKGYLTSLNKSTNYEGEAQIEDVRRVRTLLENVIRSNPTHAPGWIAAARLEEHAGKTGAARAVIARGCENCPKSQDVWLEAMRLQEPANAKIVAAQALKHNDKSVQLWLEAASLETDRSARKRVLRKGIDHVPESTEIWKEAVNLEEDPSDARLMLAKATELIPLSIDLWLALARLETPANAQKVLNKARKAIPSSHETYIAAARLQEQMGKGPEDLTMIMTRAFAGLEKADTTVKREDWMSQAESAEADGAVQTARTIVLEVLSHEHVDEPDRKVTLMNEASACAKRGSIVTARAYYAFLTKTFPDQLDVWTAAVEFERLHGNKDILFEILGNAVETAPNVEGLWLLNIKEKWLAGDPEAARKSVQDAFKSNSGSETIWLAAVKLEADSGNVARARGLLEIARSQAGTDRVWIKSVAFERIHGTSEASLAIVDEALNRYPETAKLHMQKGQILQFDGESPRVNEARAAYAAGFKACPANAALWILAANLEEKHGLVVRARSLLERGRVAIPKNISLWLASVQLERRTNDSSTAKNLMARAQQDVPIARSGPLWAERIWQLEPRTQRKPLAMEAVKAGCSDAVIHVTVARVFWIERRLEKAATWFEKAIAIDVDDGDTWAWYLQFLAEHGTAAKRKETLGRCVAAAPKHGDIWPRVRKDPRNAGLTVEEVVAAVQKELAA